jgi:hypothetical protein
MEKKLKEYSNHVEKYLNKPASEKIWDKKTGDMSSEDMINLVENRCAYFKNIIMDVQERDYEDQFRNL